MNAIYRMSDFWIGTGILIASVILVPSIGSDFNTWVVPDISIALMDVLAIALVTASFVKAKAAGKGDDRLHDADAEDSSSSRRASPFSVRGLSSISLILASVPLSEKIGFTLALFLILYCLLFSSRKKMVSSFVISAVSTYVLMMIFTYVVYLPLPLGEGFFHQISLFLLYFSWGA